MPSDGIAGEGSDAGKLGAGLVVAGPGLALVLGLLTGGVRSLGSAGPSVTSTATVGKSRTTRWGEIKATTIAKWIANEPATASIRRKRNRPPS